MSAVKPSVEVNSSTTKKHPVWINMVSGGLGSAFAKSMLSPLQRIVVLKQLGQPQHKGKSSFDLARMIAKEEGIAKGFWRGNGTSVLIRFPYGGAQFVIYNKAKFFLEETLLKRTDGGSSPFSEGVEKFILKAGAGGIAAAVAGTLVYPGEIIRLRLMSGDERYRKILPTARLVWGETNSPRNFFKGLNASLLQRVPDMVINFAVYETVKGIMDEKRALSVARCARDPSSYIPVVDSLVQSEPFAIMCGGSSAAVTAIAFSYPLDTAKRLIGMAHQLKRDGGAYRGVAHCLGSIFKEEGIRGWYRGATVEVIRCMPQVVIMWFAVEGCRNYLMALTG